MPRGTLHQTIQHACDQRAHWFAAADYLMFNKSCTKVNKPKVFEYLRDHARPLRSHTATGQRYLPAGRRVYKIDSNLEKVFDFFFSVYKRDKTGKLKYEAYFDPAGRFELNPELRSRQLRMPLRTFQRCTATLVAMRVLERCQIPKEDRAGRPAGSRSLVIFRADVYSTALKNVLTQAKIDKLTPVIDPVEPQSEYDNQLIKPYVCDGSRDATNGISINVSIATPHLEVEMSDSSHLENEQKAVAAAPLALGSRFQETQPKVDPQVSASLFDPAWTAGDTLNTLAEIGNHDFREISSLFIKTHFYEETTVQHLRELLSLTCRNSPYFRLCYSDFVTAIDNHNEGTLLNAFGRPYTRSSFLKAWPRILQQIRQEDLLSRDFHTVSSVDQCLDLMTTQAEIDFETNVQLEIRCYQTSVERQGTDYNPFTATNFSHSSHRRMFIFVAFYRLGLAARLHELLTDSERVSMLHESMKLDPLSALMCKHKYPELFAFCNYQKQDWDYLRNQTKKRYQQLLQIKVKADIWGIEPVRYPTLFE
jgi:hypothetical protein